jgi:hypothetical protein
MTQQINLYAPKVHEKRGPALIVLGIAALVAVVMLTYWQYLKGENDQLQARVTQAKAQLEKEKAAVAQMRAELAKRTDPVRLAAELNALRARATEAQEIMAQLQSGSLGTMDGFTGQLTELARAGEPGIWVTNFKILTAGKGIEIQGRSLDSQAVLRYAGEVNQRFASYGATLSALEMTPVGSATQTAIQFKLF